MDHNLIDTFLDFESQHNLDQIEIGNRRIWAIIRFRIYNIIIQKKFNTLVNHPKQGTGESILTIFKWLPLSIIFYPFIPTKKKTIIFNHPRKILFKGDYICKYTEHLSNDESCVLEAPFNNGHLKSKHAKNRYYLDLVLHCSRLYSLFRGYLPLRKEDQKKLLQLQKKVEDEFNLELPKFKNFTRTLLHKHVAITFFANRILKRIDPEELIMTVSYSDINLAFVEAAKLNDIKVIEVQHGIIDKGHVAYNFSSTALPFWFPDEFWVWSNFWRENSKLPSNSKIFVKGFPFLERYKNQSVVQKEKNTILIISQGPFAETLCQVATQLHEIYSNNGLKVVFKPHPSEVAGNPEYIKQLKRIGVQISYANNIYDLYNESKCVIGVNSTALFESAEFGVKTFVLKVSRWEMFSNVPNVQLIDDTKEVISWLQTKNDSKE